MTTPFQGILVEDSQDAVARIAWPYIPVLYANPLEQADFERRLGIVEQMKAQMRREYAEACRSIGWEPQEKAAARAWSFWPEYGELNEIWTPEDPVYTGTRAGVALSTSNSMWTVTSPGSGQVRVLEDYIAGEATASAVNRVAVQRATTGTTATNQTPELMNTRSPAAASTYATTWVAQPTLSGKPFIYHAFNAFGGGDRWVPSPGEEFYLVNGELVSERSESGTSTCSTHTIWEEL